MGRNGKGREGKRRKAGKGGGGTQGTADTAGRVLAERGNGDKPADGQGCLRARGPRCASETRQAGQPEGSLATPPPPPPRTPAGARSPRAGVDGDEVHAEPHHRSLASQCSSSHAAGRVGKRCGGGGSLSTLQCPGAAAGAGDGGGRPLWQRQQSGAAETVGDGGAGPSKGGVGDAGRGQQCPRWMSWQARCPEPIKTAEPSSSDSIGRRHRCHRRITRSTGNREPMQSTHPPLEAASPVITQPP